MSVKTEGRSRQLCHTPLTSGILARICPVRSSKADIFMYAMKYQGEVDHESVLQVLDHKVQDVVDVAGRQER